MSVIVGYARLFATFQPYDDEGYLLTSIRAVEGGAPLYDEVYTQYGPAYFWIVRAFLLIPGVESDPTGARVISLIWWVIPCVLVAWAMNRLTGSLLLSLSAYILSFLLLAVAANEPLHPGQVTVMLLALSFALMVHLYREGSGQGFLLLGVIAGVLLLIKINVGLLFAVGTVSVSLGSMASTRDRLLAAIVRSLPIATILVLVGSQLHQAWVRAFAALMVLATASYVVALRRARPSLPRSAVPLGRFLAGAVAASVGVVVLTLVEGTSAQGLLRGVVLDPIQHPDAFQIPARVPLMGVVLAAVCLGVVLVSKGGEAVSAHQRVSLRIIISVALWFVLTGTGDVWGTQFLVLLPFLWILMPGTDDSSRREGFLMAWLVATALFQALHLYPVAGSQVSWSAFPLVLLAGYSLHMGWRTIGVRAAPTWGVRASPLLVVAGVGLAAVVFTVTSLTAFASNAEVHLPGAAGLRLQEERGRRYEAVTSMLRSNCDHFYSIPGMNSFYAFAQQRPPSSLNATAWMFLFDEELQRRVVNDLRLVSRLCILRNDQMLAFWARGREIPAGPLIRFVRENFAPLARDGDFVILTREGGA